MIEKRIDLSPVGVLATIRWIILFLMIGFVSLQHDPVVDMPLHLALFAFFALSNVTLMLLPPVITRSPWINPAVFLMDIGFVTLTTYLVLGWKTDLLLVYFVIIFMSATQQSLRSVFVVTLIASAIYLTRSLGGLTEIAWADAQTILAVPAFFVVALFTSYLSHQSKKADAVLGGSGRGPKRFGKVPFGHRIAIDRKRERLKN